MSLRVRSASEADAAGLVELLNPLIATGRLALKDPVTLGQQRAFIRDFPMDSAFLLAIDAHSRIGGFQIVVIAPGAPLKGLGEIATFVAIDLHRSGTGRALTEAMFGAAQAKGCKRLRALISVDDPTALAFYAMDFRRASGGSP